MKVKPLLQRIDSANFLEQYLSHCGVQDVDRYIHADLSVCDSPWNYPNMKAGVKRLGKAIQRNEVIAVIQDADHDGTASTAIIYNFIKLANPNQSISILIHEGKEHGISVNKDENMIEQVVQSGATLLICPDAASNDRAQCHTLQEHNIDVLILDHHEIKTPADSDNVVLINHHLDPEHLNTALSGAGVTFKLVQACAEQWNIDIGNLYYDLVATSLATDSCSMLHPENYALTVYGFTHITNPAVQAMCEKFNSERHGGNCPEGVSWGMGPKVNATIRNGSMEDKYQMILSFVGEWDTSKVLQIASDAHKLQSDTVAKLTKEISKQLDQSHKVLIGYSDAANKNYSGLVANKICGQYGKPTLILRPLSSVMWSGSLRSPVEIADKINETKLAECQGHLSACGITVKRSNLDKLIQWFDASELSTTVDKPVTAQIKTQDINLNLCNDCANNKFIWGQDIPKPIFYVTFETTPAKTTVFAKRSKTVKWQFPNGATIIKYRAKGEDVDILTSQKCKVECIVSLAPNEYNGQVTPQATVEDWEITPIEDNAEEASWESMF